MLEASRRRIQERLSDDDAVLDVGAWAQPFERADWVLDLLPYETRGLYGYDRETARERFTADTWVQRDVCDREPWPFADGRFDFAICSQTLEDLRDPVWVCHELQRVARAGYVEVPSRLVEQSLGVHGPWAGWSHHHWLCDVTADAIQFVFKPPMVHFRETDHFPAGFHESLSEEQGVQQLWWEGAFHARERVFVDAGPLDAYLAVVVARHGPAPQRRSRLRRRR
jgi:hypothetical protein